MKAEDEETGLARARYAPRVLNPQRARLVEAEAAVAGRTDPREAWEALGVRGLVPMDWIDCPARAFWPYGPAKSWSFRTVREGAGYVTQVECDCADRRRRERWAPSPHPASVRAAVAIASDADGVARTEQLAREAVVRGRPWVAPQVHDVLWYVEDDPRDALPNRSLRWPENVPMRWLGGVGALLATPGGQGEARSRAAGAGDIRDDALARELGNHLALARRWRAQVNAGSTVQAGSGSVLAGRRFADVPDPIAPLLDLWRTGYAIADVNEYMIVLIAPMP